MWTVKSEAGRLRTVAVHGSWYRDRVACPGLQPFQNSTLYERGRQQLGMMAESMRAHGVKVYEWSTVFKEILEDGTLKEKGEIIESVWGGLDMRPMPEELEWRHLSDGYPLHPYYDEAVDEVVWGPYLSGAGAAPRDDSFTTQIGTVVSNMRQFHRQIAPRFSRLAYQWHPDFQKNVEIVWDAHEHFGGRSKYLEYKGVRGAGAAIEGGDIQPIDEETILCARAASRVTHLDTVINWPDKGRALVLPYVLESKLARPRMPEKRLWVKLIEARRGYLERNHQPIDPAYVLNTKDLIHAGETEVYRRGKDGKPVLLEREENLLDYLIREGKLESDGLIPVGGWPERENDVLHVITTMQQQGRTGVNGVAIKPGTFMVWESNIHANKALEEAGIDLIKLDDANAVGGAGPHCYTCPLERDAI